MIDKMPQEYKQELTKQTSYTHTQPRKWGAKEIEWLKQKHAEGYAINEIAYSMDRSVVSVSIKLKRLSKKEDSYNKNHIQEKYELNKQFIELIKPKTILDLYCGEKSFYKSNYDVEVLTNDINKDIIADYHKDALKLLCELYSKNKKYDFIDLDPFGSAYDLFDLAIKMAKKGIAITFGELGHKRWKRLDYVQRFYNINEIKDFSISNLVKHVQQIGLRNKKRLLVVYEKEWLNIGRVWFKIEETNIINSQIKEKQQLSLFDEDYE